MPEESKGPAKGRWPGWVYAEGAEPDYRFSFANERTFLAWIRTSLALLAAAVALDVVELDLSRDVQRLLAGILVVLGLLSAVAAWIRWALAERAIRRGEPLPSFGFAMLFTLGLVVAGVVVILVGL
jgi:putative membrane protein